MDNADVKIEISEELVESVINKAEGTRGILNAIAKEVASRANSMASEKSGVWHETGKPHTPGRKGGKFHDHGNVKETIGGTEAKYAYKPAIRGKSGLVALVHTGNYAAMLDTHKHNTMLKAL